MARIMEPSPEQERGYRQWVAARPPNVRVVAERFEPWSLYRLKTSQHRVTIASFGEADNGDVTLMVTVSAQFNLVMFERNVFGVTPDDLEPCDLPDDTEPVGAIMSSADVEENIDALRIMARPDLWEWDADGKAVPRSADAEALARMERKS